MTPQEKAEELILKMYYHTNDVNIIAPTQFISKQCALVAVDEMIEVAYWQGVKDYLKEVKQEIEKL